MSDVLPRARPLVGVGLFVLDEHGRFLLVRRRGSHGAGCWGLVGGHLEFGRTPGQAAADEAFEEVGLVLDPDAIAFGPFTNDVFESEGKHYVTLFGSVRLPAGQEPENLEPEKCSELGWFGFDALPEPLFAPFASFLLQSVRPPFPHA